MSHILKNKKAPETSIYSLIDWLREFNIGIELHSGLLPVVEGAILKHGPETWHNIFDPPWRGWVPRFSILTDLFTYSSTLQWRSLTKLHAVTFSVLSQERYDPPPSQVLITVSVVRLSMF